MERHEEESPSKNLFITVLLNTTITLVELVGGLVAHSLALISDSFHNLSDTMAGVLTFYTYRLSLKDNNRKFTFGYKRAEILSAIFNASLLIGLAVVLFKEAIVRFYHPQIVNGFIMLPVAIVGLAANSISVLLLHRHSEHNLNVKSVYLHLVSDALSSLGVVLGAILIYFYKLYWLDPVFTILIASFMTYESVKVIIETVNILMECSPSWVNVSDLQKDIESMPQVNDVHHMHVWRLSDRLTLFEAHVNIKDMPVSDTKEVRSRIEKLLKEKYKIDHATIQFEYGEHKGDGLIKEHFR
jgi:cobalt-zinc-cadmium efflux system protein